MGAQLRRDLSRQITLYVAIIQTQYHHQRSLMNGVQRIVSYRAEPSPASAVLKAQKNNVISRNIVIVLRQPIQLRVKTSTFKFIERMHNLHVATVYSIIYMLLNL